MTTKKSESRIAQIALRATCSPKLAETVVTLNESASSDAFAARELRRRCCSGPESASLWSWNSE